MAGLRLSIESYDSRCKKGHAVVGPRGPELPVCLPRGLIGWPEFMVACGPVLSHAGPDN